MLNRLILSPTVAAALFVGVCLAPPAVGQAGKPTANPELPVKKVVMFSSGVSFFEHAGKVKGNAAVEMKFDVADINDLLKSMVLRDLDGGKISTVSLASRDPITRTLRTFAIDLTRNPTLGSLLGQIRGEKVIVQAPEKTVGVIVSVERRAKKVGEEWINNEYLNLLTEDGLRSIKLDTVGGIQLADKKLDQELRQALMVLAASHATDKKSVKLNFIGAGERDVRVGYVQESPVWKTSYRLVLADDKPLLQGWAIVENTTEDDWRNVDLTLVSGRPISFVMNLYRPLYVNRPVVRPELHASVTPRIYDQDLAGADRVFEELAKSESKPNTARLARGKSAGFGGDDFGDSLDGVVDFKSADKAPEVMERLSESVEVAAQGGDVGELFRYQIATPVTLQRGRSAMLPIVNDSVEVEKVSIFNASVHPKFPLNGLRLKNSTKLHLMQGPVTVFDEGAYAGDSRIADLQPGTERLLSYAMDLDVEVVAKSPSVPEKLEKVIINRGTLIATTKYTRKTEYTVKNSGSETKQVLIEKDLNSSWKLVEPAAPAEKTRDLYRFAVAAEPGKPAKLSVREERGVNQSISVKNLDSNRISLYLSSKVVDESIKAAIKNVQARKTAIGKIAKEKQEALRKIKVIEQEQSRIRQNMAKLPQDSDLYRRYVTKFTEEENEIESLRQTVTGKTKQETQLRQELEDYLTNLTLE